MSNVILVGTQWGDEGKGRFVDFLAEKSNTVVRFQGGDNAGHTVEIGDKQFKLHLVPSGIFNPDKINIIGPRRRNQSCGFVRRARNAR